MMKTVGQYTIMKMPGAREVSLCGGGYDHEYSEERVDKLLERALDEVTALRIAKQFLAPGKKEASS